MENDWTCIQLSTNQTVCVMLHGVVFARSSSPTVDGRILGVLILGDLILGDLILGDLILGDLVLGDLILGDLIRGDLILGGLIRDDRILGIGISVRRFTAIGISASVSSSGLDSPSKITAVLASDIFASRKSSAADEDDET